MKRLVYVLIALSLMVAFVPIAASADGGCDPCQPCQGCEPLIAGGGNPESAIQVGCVCVVQDGGELQITYILLNPGDPPYWRFEEVHLHVATTLEGIPQKNGNPTPGQFDWYDYGPFDHPWRARFTVPIPDDWGGGPLFIAAHAVVTQCTVRWETAWAGNLMFPGKSWATYFTFTPVP